MTPERAKQMLPFIEAFAQGKKIQLKVCGKWRDEEVLDFSSDPSDYRIKPQPREFWVIDGPCCARVVFTSRQDAETKMPYYADPKPEIIHVIEDTK